MAYTSGKVRWRLMNQGRALAGSGEHEDHRTILGQLQADPEFAMVRRWIEDRSFLAQLDRLCALSRCEGAGTGSDPVCTTLPASPSALRKPKKPFHRSRESWLS
jgi:hypothetical protein